MVHKKYTEEQIIAVLKEGEAGAGVADLCRKYGMSDATYYNWKAKYAGLTVSELKRLKALEEENRRLKQIVAEQALDIRALKELLSKTSEAQGQTPGSDPCQGESWAERKESLLAGQHFGLGLSLPAEIGQRYCSAPAPAGASRTEEAFRQSPAAHHAQEGRPGDKS